MAVQRSHCDSSHFVRNGLTNYMLYIRPHTKKLLILISISQPYIYSM